MLWQKLRDGGRIALDWGGATLGSTGLDFAGWMIGLTLGRRRFEFWFGRREDC